MTTVLPTRRSVVTSAADTSGANVEEQKIDEHSATEHLEPGSRRWRADLLVQHLRHDVLGDQQIRCDHRAGHPQTDGSSRVLLRRHAHTTTSAATMVSGQPMAIRAPPSQPVSSLT